MGRKAAAEDDTDEPEDAPQTQHVEATMEPEPPSESSGPAEIITLECILRERLPITSWLAVGELPEALRASKTLKILFSSLMTVYVSFEVLQAPSEQRASESKRLRAAAKLRAPNYMACAPCFYVTFALRETPVKRLSIVRKLAQVMPCVSWEDARGFRVKCRDDLAMLDSSMKRNASMASEVEASGFLQEPHMYKNLQRLTLSLWQIERIPDNAVFGQVHRLKIVCRDSLFMNMKDDMAAVSRIFPNASRVHLAMIPSALLNFCGPEYVAPSDFRLTLLGSSELGDNADAPACKSNFFVSAHLFTLPFNWMGNLFSKVMRLQMNELATAHHVLSIEKMMDLLQSLPLLRRLGTISSAAMYCLDLTRCQLEEVVMTLEMDDSKGFFRFFVSLEKDRVRSRLKRLAVHLLANDGCSKLDVETENLTCAGWYQVASALLHPIGFITFSGATQQILETVPFQLPWFAPLHFCLDNLDYSGGCLPRSTPIAKSLAHFCKDNVARPGGTLVSGPMRPSADADSAPARSPGSGGCKDSPASPKRSGSSRNLSSGPWSSDASESDSPSKFSHARRKSRQTTFLPWMTLQVADVVESLRQLAEAERLKFL